MLKTCINGDLYLSGIEQQSFPSQLFVTGFFSQDGAESNEFMSSNGASSKTDSMAIGPLKVSLRQGDITEETNEAIMNSVGPKLNLNASEYK